MKRLIVAAMVVFALRSFAGVIVIQDVSPGATSWPGIPRISIIANPSTATSSATFTNGATTNGAGQFAFGGSTNISQTFTITVTNYQLTTISIYAGGGTGTGAGTNLVLNLFDLGRQVAPNPAPYVRQAYRDVIGGNLLGGGAGLPITYTNQANGVLQFDFTGADQVVLQVGHMYAFELGGTIRTRSVNWYGVTVGNPYSGGAAYTNKYWRNGSNNVSADMAMAVYGNVYTNPITPPTPLAGASTINWTNVRQRIDGFGASSSFAGTGFSGAQYDLLFSTNTGIGLSLVRSQVLPGGTAGPGETNIMKNAIDRGARAWSAPWSPQASFKIPQVVNGGNFAGGDLTNQAYANQLANYVVTLKNRGINLYALSIQNEPNITNTSYATCWWNAQQISNFVPYLFNALVASNVAATKIMIPESFQWQNSISLYTTTMENTNLAAMVGIIANHNYDGIEPDPPTGVPAAITNYGKARWETEVAILEPSGSSDSSMQNGIYWAGRVHAFMTIAEANAWHYWWLIYGNSTPNQGLTDIDKNVLAKRGYVLGNFSRFVRPDYYRIGVVTNSGAVMVSAYRDTNSTRFAIVAINNNSTNSVNQTFNLTNFNAATVTPWVTSPTTSLASQPTVTVSNSAFIYEMPALSVVTFVGQALPPNSAPTNITLANSTVSENQSIATPVGTFSTSDPDAGNTFTYSLVAGTGSGDNGAFNISGSSLVTAAMFNYELSNSYSIRIRSTDQGGLFFEKPFTITVSDLNEPPSPTPVMDQTVNAGVMLLLTNAVIDPDLPPQTMAFSLLSPPPDHATLDGSSGVFSWRPHVNQANSTNVIRVRVDDDGAPVLSGTNVFTIVVNPAPQPLLSSIAAAPGQISLLIDGITGPDYTVWVSTNLVDWQVLFTTNSPTTPFTVTDPTSTDDARFYRVQIGP